MRVQVGYTQDEWDAVNKFVYQDEDTYLEFALKVAEYDNDIWTLGLTSTGLADAIIDNAIRRLNGAE